jgi:hypothetical protein
MKICTCGASPRRVERVCAGASGGLVEVRGGAGGASRCGFGCVRRSHDASHAGARRGAVVGEVRWFGRGSRGRQKRPLCDMRKSVHRKENSFVSSLHETNLKTRTTRIPDADPSAESRAESGLRRPRPQRVRDGDARARPKVRTQWGVPTGAAERHTTHRRDSDCAHVNCNCKAVRSPMT